MTAQDQVEDLIREFRSQIGLSEVDAYRSAFCVLAYNRGWSAARTGRYLGISRARVGQRIDKLLGYAQTREDVPILTRLMSTALPTHTDGPDLPVAFEIATWQDRRFAQGMLKQVA